MTQHPARAFWWMLIAVGAILAGCVTPRPQTVDVLAPDAAEAAYRAAIRDAETADVGEISTQLTPITPANDALIRRDTASERRLLVVTWGSATALSGAPGDTVTASDDVWITVAPQVQNACRTMGRTGAALDLRLSQLLGLPPDSGYDRFYSLWVDPADLFRPCPDPEISDRECERSLPASERFLTVAPSHQRWFQALRQSTYGPDGYPWTRLGYTYDWHPATDAFGLSEFVVRPGATVEIEAITPVAAYCQSDG